MTRDDESEPAANRTAMLQHHNTIRL